MSDFEKVIKGLECCIFSDEECECLDECPYHDDCWETDCELGYILKKDALELLKRPDCEYAEHDSAGCLGYAGCEQDDEPIEFCKKCDAYTGNKSERQ